jgi:hypothetical protein
MTDNEIIKALECHANPDLTSCTECPLLNIQDCCYLLSKEAVDLINCLRAKNEALQMDNEQLQSDIVNANMNLEHMTAEVERLNVELSARMELEKIAKAEFTLLSAYFQVKSVRAEAIKEFERTVRIEINEAIETNRRAKQQRVERLNAKGIVYDDEFCSYCDGKLHALCGIAEFIDNLVKEMVGES